MIRSFMKGRQAYDSGNVKFVMDKLPGWLTCSHEYMSYSYVKDSFLKGKPFNPTAAVRLKDKNDFIVQYTGTRLYLPNKDTFYDDPYVAGEVNIWNAENVHKVLTAIYVEEVMSKFSADTLAFTGNYFTNEFMENLANMLQTIDETTPIALQGKFKMLPKIAYPTEYSSEEVESFEFIPKYTPYSTIYEYEENKVDIADLSVEEILELDKKYVEEVYLPQCANSYYLHYESCVLLKDNLDENCDGTVAGTNNIFQMQWPTAKGTDTCVIMIARVGEKMDVQEIWHNFWVEDFDLTNEDISLTYQEAFDKFMESNYTKPHSRQCVLRKEVGPVEGVAPQYIFGNNIEHYYVDAVSGDVKDYNPVFEGYEDDEKKYHKVILQLTNGTTEDNLEQIVAEGEFAMWIINPDNGYKVPSTVEHGSIAKMVNGQDAVLSDDVVDSDFTVVCECVSENSLENVYPTSVACPKCGTKMNYIDTGVVVVKYEWFTGGIRTHLSGHGSQEYQFHYHKCPYCGEWEMVEWRETPSWWDDLWDNDCPFTRGDIIKKWQNNEFRMKDYEGHEFTKW
jgi:hypothetical protein